MSIGYFRGPLLMSALRKRWVRLRNPHATVSFGPHTYLGPGFSLHMPFGGTFVTGERVEFRRNFRAELAGPDSRIEFGAGAVCTYDVLIQCTTDRPMLEQGYDFTPIRIADDATITTKCTIIADVGTRAFIGANTVVTRPVPPYTVAVGTPARAVEYFGPPEDAPDGVATRNPDASA